ncbi:GlcNAc-PI de-N-acetylase [Stackebrandtia endophytica]|uniref:GlcNAc-PI de-N-acetylase n=1 Tax=Stackebrandtia endophytica TaxID=1496996 RepID=A0A543AZK8_9ACTN|nr:PIG-L family deacetylase [Stackebrandtia endophytica]TQL78014.1 GlcNAc-PI de-N-acetylase [Stackebrandtia endophytica]
MTYSSHPHPEPDNSIRLARRPLLLGALGSAAAVALAGCTDRAESAQPPDAPAGHATHLQIIAHPDDDFYFFNLDLARSLQDGHRIITVCLSAGEADGKNLARKEAAWESTPTDYAGYAAARFTGARRTYAQMATGDVDAEWEREAYPVSNYLRVEKATLVANPNVILLYFSLLENGKHSGHGGDRRLNNLWNGTAGDLPTLPLTGGKVSEVATLSRDDLIDSLVQLLDEFQPDVVRIMDADPDPQLHDNDHPQFAEQDGYSDHIDHTGAAWFAAGALERWLPQNQQAHTRVIGYRGYYNQRWPRNLSPDARQEKGRYLDTYAWADERDCGDPVGCGDSKLPADGVGKRYGSSTIHRHQGADPSLVLGHDGRIHAASVVSGQLNMYSGDPTTRSLWKRAQFPRELPLLPYTSATVDQDGQILIAGIEYHIGDNPSSHVRNVVLAEIDPTTPDDVRWHDLGNPAAAGSEAVRDVGGPQVLVSSDGIRMVFCRNHGKGLSARMELEHGQWTGWIDLGGENTQDGLTAIVDHADDSIRLFAAASDGIRMWHVVSQDEHSTELLTIDPPAGPVTAVSDRNGRIILLARQAGTSAIVMYQRPGSNEEWLRSPVILGGNGGIDQVSAMVMRPWETTVAILHRDDEARSSFAVVNYADLRPGTAVTQPDWAQSGPQQQRQPTMVLDRSGRVFSMAVGMDGSVYATHQAQAGTGNLGRWAQLPLR